MTESSFFHLHAHSEYSCLDGMPPVESMVESVDAHGQLGLGLTDHGNMSGVFELYRYCNKAGIAPFPGEEFYICTSLEKDAKRYHIGVVALDLKGYKGMVKLSSLSHQRDHYHYKPRFTVAEFIEWGNEYGPHVAVLTGCYFGLIIQTLINKGPNAAGAYLRKLAKVFPNLFGEIQHHKTKHKQSNDTDKSIAIAMYDLASSLGLPVIVTNDAHYCDQGDKQAHDMMKRMMFYSGSETDDVIFPGDSYHLASAKWIKRHYERDGLGYIWDAADSSYDFLLDNNRLTIPILDKYKFMLPEWSSNPDNSLVFKVKKGMEMHDLMVYDTYENRMKFELNVISKMGMASYFLMEAENVDWANKNGVLIEARGSANGSLICYALGITAVDPVLWNLSFDRFLSLDRQKPPDIDLDIDRDHRVKFIEAVGQRQDITPIGTYARLGEDERTGRGSLFVKYLSWKRNSDPSFPKVETMNELAHHEPEDVAVLRKLGRMRVFQSPGTHAAGYVLSPPEAPLADYVPNMLIPSSKSTVTQMTMDEVENAGYVKFDFLGQASLTVMRRCLEMLGRIRSDGAVDWTWIPLEDKDALALMREGVPDNGIFQFEGYSTAKGAKQMKVNSVMDAVFCLALYRPALMKSGFTDQYLANRKAPKKVTYLHPIFEKVLKETHGVFVFQEQVIQVLRDLGMEYQDLNDMLKAVKASNEKITWAETVFERIEPKMLKLCIKQGMSTQQARMAWKTILDFSDYGFNRAHATGYALRAYRMAYLKAHHQLEFFTALLETWAGSPKERIYIHEAKRCKVRLLRPNVNVSGVSWTLDPKTGGIRKGLLSLKGVGVGAAQEIIDNAPFTDMDDLLDRCDGGPGMVTGGKSWRKNGTLNGVLGALQEAGALEELIGPA